MSNFFQLILVQGDNHIFWLQVSVNDSTLPMQVVQANQNLLGHPTNQREWNTLVVVSFHDFEKVNSQNLKHHDEVLPIWTGMNEGV